MAESSLPPSPARVTARLQILVSEEFFDEIFAVAYAAGESLSGWARHELELAVERAKRSSAA